MIKRIGTVAYMLNLLSTSKIHHVFHVSCLKKKLWEHDSPLPTLPPIDHEGKVQTDPKLILETKMKKVGNHASIEVLIIWIGAPLEDSSWESLWRLRNLYAHLVGIVL